MRHLGSTAALLPAAFCALASGGAAQGGPQGRGITCEDLADVRWSGFRVDEAQLLPATDQAPAHCRVRGTIDTEVHFELLMPSPGSWNGRFVMGGGGGFVGSVQNQALWYAPTLLADGYATVGTDTGHRGTSGDASWALGRPDRRINFGHRAVHLTAEEAKTIIRMHYGRDIDYSYFLGCSRGGGQAMMESQRYPDDFDGLVAGAPAFDWTGWGALMVGIQQAMYPDPSDLSKPVVTPAALELLGDAVLEKCDGLDGVKDGILADPRTCDFRPGDLPRCSERAPGAGCVTESQLEAIRTVYRGVTLGDARSVPGYPLGSETLTDGWDNWITAVRTPAWQPNYQFVFGSQIYKYLVFGDSTWSYASYDFSTWAEDSRAAAAILDATDTDLTPFKVSGGKLILWHGWADAGIGAMETLEYYDAVRERDADAANYARLFLLPGVLHCLGGPGPDHVDWVGAIRRWVEEGRAPTRLTAVKRGGGGEVELARPVCAYPAGVVYDGRGDPTKETSFRCEVPPEGR
jgi:hypothetical protein